MGISNLPAGQAQQTFPIVTWAGTNAPTNWGGTTANVTLAENYTALDNLQWTVGKHSFTFGGQVAWLLYNTISATGGTTPITLANAVTETAGLTGTSTTAFTVTANTGLSYASFLIGPNRQGQLHGLFSASGVRRALPRHLALCPGQLEGDPEADSRPRPALRFLPERQGSEITRAFSIQILPTRSPV
jgi:hypothetical protein